MVAVTVAERMTAAQFLGQPDRPGAEWLQLVEGEVVVTDPHARHNFAQGDLVFAFETWSRSKGGRGRAMLPLDVALDDLNVFEPDIAWYAEGRVPTRDSVRPFAMPDLAVEIRSPSTWRYDIGAKKSAYERHGLPELWLVDTEADVVLVFRRSNPDALAFDVALELDRAQTLHSPLLPGFALNLGELFPAR